jgi:hypothetical protein
MKHKLKAEANFYLIFYYTLLKPGAKNKNKKPALAFNQRL